MIRTNRYARACTMTAGLTAAVGGLLSRFHPFGLGDSADFATGAVIGVGIGISLVLLIKARNAPS